MSVTVVDVLLCPDCPSARTVRSLVLSDDFWINFGFMLLPLAVSGLVIGWFARRIDREVEP